MLEILRALVKMEILGFLLSGDIFLSLSSTSTWHGKEFMSP